MKISDFSTLTASMGFTERDDPFSLFKDWLADAEKSEPNDPNGMALATADEVRPAQCAHGADEGLVGTRVCILHKFRKPEGAGTFGDGKSRFAVSLEVLAATGAGEGAGGAGDSVGGGCLFQIAAAGQQDRCLGFAAIATVEDAV